jgi:hypothetical protein
MSMADRVSVAEQSMIVSEVAMKLEEFARKAMHGRSGGRTRRSGVVTPPTVSTSSLFTYDDEYDIHHREESLIAALCASPLAAGTMTGDSISFGSSTVTFASPKAVTPLQELALAAPVIDSKTALAITNDMVLRSPENLRSALIAPTAVACFCMSTSPCDDKDLCTKILHLIASCEKLSDEFQLYRSALHPVRDSQGVVAVHSYAMSVQQIWQREASRGDAVRDFKTFAVNCIHKLLASDTLAISDQKVLERTAALWRASIDMGAY